MGNSATAGRPASRRDGASATPSRGGFRTLPDGVSRQDTPAVAPRALEKRVSVGSAQRPAQKPDRKPARKPAGKTVTKSASKTASKPTKATAKKASPERSQTPPKRSRVAQKTTTRLGKTKRAAKAAVKLVKRRTAPPKRKTSLEAPLDLTDGLIEVAQDLVALIPEFAHIRLDAVHFTIFHSRAAQRTLTYARCYPLPRGMQRRGRRWYQLTPVYTPARKKAMYLLAFAWPRFWNMRPRARLETLVHELYHIGEAFDGEPRTFESGGWHGQGRKWFDGVIRKLCDRYLPPGFELDYPVLNVALEPDLRVTGERLRRPHWEEVFRSL